MKLEIYLYFILILIGIIFSLNIVRKLPSRFKYILMVMLLQEKKLIKYWGKKKKEDTEEKRVFIKLQNYILSHCSPYMNVVFRKGLISSGLKDFNHGTLPLLSAPLPLHSYSPNSTVL